MGLQNQLKRDEIHIKLHLIKFLKYSKFENLTLFQFNVLLIKLINRDKIKKVIAISINHELKY